MQIPKFYIWFTIVALFALGFNIGSVIVGAITGNFIIHPVYAIMLIIGFAGLLIASIITIKDYKNKNKNKE